MIANPAFLRLFLLAASLALCLPLPAASAEPNFVLAISWQPAFCETASKKPECSSQNEERVDTRQFSLHGLWPQPVGRAYCGVAQEEIDKDKSGKWRSVTMTRLPKELWDRLRVAMPGTKSGLQRHEWIKHGTCIPGSDPERYYSESLSLLDMVNASKVAQLFAGNIGGQLSGEEIRAAFDESFGEGAGKRVRIACKQDGERRLIYELTIGLSGEIGASPDLPALIAAASPTDPGCPGGFVDPVGLQ